MSDKFWFVVWQYVSGADPTAKFVVNGVWKGSHPVAGLLDLRERCEGDPVLPVPKCPGAGTNILFFAEIDEATYMDWMERDGEEF